MSLKAVVCVENKGDSYMEYRLAGIDDIEDVFYIVKVLLFRWRQVVFISRMTSIQRKKILSQIL